MYQFIHYPKCSTCQQAKKWLDMNHIAYEEVHIVENVPTKERLTAWIDREKYSLKNFFNTSGLKYRELNLKERLPNMTKEEQIALLATDGMLIKRPILVGDEHIFVGFKVSQWETML